MDGGAQPNQGARPRSNQASCGRYSRSKGGLNVREMWGSWAVVASNRSGPGLTVPGDNDRGRRVQDIRVPIGAAASKPNDTAAVDRHAERTSRLRQKDFKQHDEYQGQWGGNQVWGANRPVTA